MRSRACGASRRRCSIASCRPTGRSSSSRATASSTGCSRWPRCTSACPTRRSLRPTRCRPGSTARCSASSTASSRRWSSPRTALRYERALRAVLTDRAELVVSESPGELRATSFAELEGTASDRRPSTTRAARRPATPSPRCSSPRDRPGRPKGVINTQRMLCSNQEMIRSVLAFLADEPPVICDWLPWNHTAGGNHNFGLVLLQRRHALHRRGQADAGALRRHAPQPARDSVHGALHRAAALRDADAAPAQRRGAARDVLQPT